MGLFARMIFQGLRGTLDEARVIYTTRSILLLERKFGLHLHFGCAFFPCSSLLCCMFCVCVGWLPDDMILPLGNIWDAL